jgi:hypothetical protein
VVAEQRQLSKETMGERLEETCEGRESGGSPKDCHHVVLLGGPTDVTAMRTFGEGLDSGKGELNTPASVAVLDADAESADDFVVITDTGNHRMAILGGREERCVCGGGGGGGEL